MSNKRNNTILNPIHKSYGDTRRENLSKEIMYKGNPFPKPVQYKDIDDAVKKWVDSDLDLIYDGKKLPTMILLSNQRFGEYTQSWEFRDTQKTLLMNFKTITRDSNPQQGTQHGGFMNIPGERKYTIAILEVMEDSGIECYDVYQIPQPMSVDLLYSISIFTDKLELVNAMSEKVQDLFKSIECYIRVNGHFMSLLLEDISDESEYNLEGRKFFSQTFKIKCMAYILKEEDFTKERIPKRLQFKIENLDKKYKPNIVIEDFDGDEFQDIELSVNFMEGAKDIAKFRVDEDIYVYRVSVDNSCSATIIRNDDNEPVDITKGFTIRKHEKLVVKIKRINTFGDVTVTLYGRNPNYKPQPKNCIVQNKDVSKHNYVDTYDYVNKECDAENYLDEGRHKQ